MKKKYLILACLILLLPHTTKTEDATQDQSATTNLKSVAIHSACVFVGFFLSRESGKIALAAYALQRTSVTKRYLMEATLIKEHVAYRGIKGIISSATLIKILNHPATPAVSGVTCGAGLALVIYGVHGLYTDISRFITHLTGKPDPEDDL